MVKDAGKVYVERTPESELEGVSDDPTYLPRADPPDQDALLERFRVWVKNNPGNFGAVLSGWIKSRLKMNLSVNPGPIDPNERPKRNPTKTFRSALESVFNDVRARQSTRSKRKK